MFKNLEEPAGQGHSSPIQWSYDFQLNWQICSSLLPFYPSPSSHRTQSLDIDPSLACIPCSSCTSWGWKCQYQSKCKIQALSQNCVQSCSTLEFCCRVLHIGQVPGCCDVWNPDPAHCPDQSENCQGTTDLLVSGFDVQGVPLFPAPNLVKTVWSANIIITSTPSIIELIQVRYACTLV